MALANERKYFWFKWLYKDEPKKIINYSLLYHLTTDIKFREAKNLYFKKNRLCFTDVSYLRKRKKRSRRLR